MKSILKQTNANCIFRQMNLLLQKRCENYKWKTINGLGYSNNAITLFPLDQHYFKKEKPAVSYEFEIQETGNYEVEVHFLPTHSNNFDHEICIQINENAIQIIFNQYQRQR